MCIFDIIWLSKIYSFSNYVFDHFVCIFADILPVPNQIFIFELTLLSICNFWSLFHWLWWPRSECWSHRGRKIRRTINAQWNPEKAFQTLKYLFGHSLSNRGKFFHGRTLILYTAWIWEILRIAIEICLSPNWLRFIKTGVCTFIGEGPQFNLSQGGDT